MNTTPELKNAGLVKRSSQVLATQVDSQVVILNLESGHFAQLNAVGSRIWDLLETPMSHAALCNALVERFDVDADQCAREVDEFLKRLRDQGLVEDA